MSSAFRAIISASIILIRPLIGPTGVCRYYRSCTIFAYHVFRRKPVWKSCYLVARRISSCHPFW